MADVFLFGATSMLGWSILRARDTTQVTAFCNDNTRRWPSGVSRAIDLDDGPAVAALFARERPRLVINCAGVCDVGACEDAPEFARTVNVEGTRNLLVHAPPEPISVYGRTRVEAEQLVIERPNTLVTRAGLWIGPSATGRIGHLDWLHGRHRRGLPMTIVSDECRSAVWAEDAARRVWDLARSSIVGIRHITATRAVSRLELARYLDRHFAIGATFATESRAERRTPHIGNVELATIHTDRLAAPLPSVVPH